MFLHTTFAPYIRPPYVNRQNQDLLIILESHVLAFMRMLVAYHENLDKRELPSFMKEKRRRSP